MYPQRLFKEVVPFLSALFARCAAAFVLAVRKPVVVVSDKYYATLYGEKREAAKALENSLISLRRVRIFRFPEDADSKAAVIDLQTNFPNPYCVVFPYRYAQAGVLYAGEPDAAKTFILEERNMHRPVTGKAIYVPSAWQQDFFMAGRLSALLAAEPILEEDAAEEDRLFPRPHPIHHARSASDKTSILLLIQDSPAAETLAAFNAGLKAGGWKDEAAIASHVTSTQIATTAAAALVSSINSFVQHQAAMETSCILFSSAPVDVFPHYIKAVIDDSVWVLLPGLIRQAAKPPSEDNTGQPVRARVKMLPDKNTDFYMYVQLFTAALPAL